MGPASMQQDGDYKVEFTYLYLLYKLLGYQNIPNYL